MKKLVTIFNGKRKLVNDSGSHDIVMTFTNHEKNHIDIENDEYSILAYFIYKGKNKMGIPNSVKIVLNSDENIIPLTSIRLVDETNLSNIIAEDTNINVSENILIYDLGAISNLPDNQAIFSIQGKVNSNDDYGKVNLFSFSMEF